MGRGVTTKDNCRFNENEVICQFTTEVVAAGLVMRQENRNSPCFIAENILTLIGRCFAMQAFARECNMVHGVIDRAPEQDYFSWEP